MHSIAVSSGIAIVRSMTTEAINHDPAITFLQTGNQFSGRPSIGAWLSYGLGSDNENLPAFVVLIDHERKRRSTALLATLGDGVSAIEISGSSVPIRKRTRALSE